jgi:hypothetical protein
MRLSPLLLVVACAANPSAATRLDRVPNGEWGGEHVRLTVVETGGTIEFDCAHGNLDEPLVLDRSGDGQQMSLEVTLEGGETAGTFSLAKGGSARLFKCR